MNRNVFALALCRAQLCRVHICAAAELSRRAEAKARRLRMRGVASCSSRILPQARSRCGLASSSTAEPPSTD